MERTSTELLLDRRPAFVRRWHTSPTHQVESVAEHQWAVAHIGFILAYELAPLGVPVDPYRVMAAGLVHDVEEVITGDLPHAFKKRSGVSEVWGGLAQSVAGELFIEGRFEVGTKLRSHVRWLEQDTATSRIVGFADKLAAYAFARDECRFGNTFFVPTLRRTATFLLGMVEEMAEGEALQGLYPDLFEMLRDDAVRT